MCDKTGVTKGPGTNVAKPGVRCNTCGVTGHYAQSCPSKQITNTSVNPVKVNLAAAKINTKDK